MNYLPKPPKIGRKSKNPDRERFEIYLDPISDKDIVRKLNKQPNKSGYVKMLIRKDIKRHS